MIGIQELYCIKCKTARKVRLGEPENNNLGSNGSVSGREKSHGIAWVLDQANELLPRLSKQSAEQPTDYAALALGGTFHYFTQKLERQPKRFA